MTCERPYCERPLDHDGPCGRAQDDNRPSIIEERDALRAEVEHWKRAGIDAQREVVEENERLGAEVERLRAELENERANGPTAHEWTQTLAEVERLRGLVAEAEWVSGGYIMGPPSCPWCSYPVEEEGHSEKCPAFSARGEVRR